MLMSEEGQSLVFAGQSRAALLTVGLQRADLVTQLEAALTDPAILWIINGDR
jgi:hypothetical protein